MGLSPHGNVTPWERHLVERDVGSRCHTRTQLWQATARMEAHSGFQATAATFLCRRCFSDGMVALRGWNAVTQLLPSLWGLIGVFLLLLEPDALKEMEYHVVDEWIADEQHFLA